MYEREKGIRTQPKSDIAVQLNIYYKFEKVFETNPNIFNRFVTVYFQLYLAT